MEQTNCLFCGSNATREQSQFSGEWCYKCDNCGTYRTMDFFERNILKYSTTEKNIIAKHLSENKDLIHDPDFVVTQEYIEKILHNKR